MITFENINVNKEEYIINSNDEEQIHSFEIFFIDKKCRHLASSLVFVNSDWLKSSILFERAIRLCYLFRFNRACSLKMANDEPGKFSNISYVFLV